MRLSIFSVLDHYPALARTQPELYDQVIETALLAERLGYDALLIAEHHFHEYGAVPDPIALLGVLAARTRRLRLGPAISVLTFRNPIAVAESYAMIDVLSRGRLLLGVGSGYLSHEFAGFGIDPAEKRERFDEALLLVERLLRGERVSHAGRFHRLDEVAINIRPLQQPLPPVHVAILRQEAAYHVGRQGRRILSIPYATLERFEEVEGVVREFRRGRAEAGQAPADDDAIFAFHCHIAASDEAARADAAPAFERYVASRLYARRQTWDEIIESGLALFGSVETVAAKLARLQAWGVSQVALLVDFGMLEPALAQRTMTLAAREVLPRLLR